MPLVTKCTHCNKPSQIPENYAGKQVRCPTCKQIFVAQTALPVPPKPVAAMANRETAQVAQQQLVHDREDHPPLVPPLQRGRRGPFARGEKRGWLVPRRLSRCPLLRRWAMVPPCPIAIDGFAAGAAGHGEHLRLCPLSRVQGPAKPRATLCLDCGWVQPDTTITDSDEQPVLCTNPACGVANPPGEATASAAARRCRPRPAPCCTAATASRSCSRWAASARSTWPPTPRAATAPSPSRT